MRMVDGEIKIIRDVCCLDGPNPKIRSRCNGLLRSDFGLASELLTKGLGPKKSHSQAVASLGEDGEVWIFQPLSLC